jgi:hypothetical protein
MKFLHCQPHGSGSTAFVFQISQREKDWLLATLKLYPLLEAGDHQISRNKKIAAQAEQQLLEDSMAQQRQEHRRKLDQFLAASRRFVPESRDQYRFIVTAEQCEWLLQILNDVRVGSWVKLGRPEMEHAPKLAVTPGQARYLAAIEMSGYFQMVLLDAFK